MMRGLLLMLSFVVIPGCGGNPDLATVSGVVTLNGDPLEGATVTFTPLDGKRKDAPTSFGKTDRNGRFVLKTADGSKGALIGKHRVTITKTHTVDDADDSIVDVKDEVPAEWNRDSKQTIEVPAGGTKEADFDITSPKKK